MVTGADRPETVKIKATISADQVDAALAAYHLSCRDTTSPPNDGPCSPPATHRDLTSWNCPSRAEPEDAALVQPAFLASIRRRGLDPYAFQQTKTRHVLQYLAAFASM